MYEKIYFCNVAIKHTGRSIYKGKLINVYKYDINFDLSDYKLSELIDKNEDVSYIRLFLWNGMIPLTENSAKTYITGAEL